MDMWALYKAAANRSILKWLFGLEHNEQFKKKKLN